MSIFALCGCGHSVSEKDPTLWITDEEFARRTALDFSLDSVEAAARLKEFYPELTKEQVEEWESTKALESYMVDGVKKYFVRAVRNLFRIDSVAGKVYDSHYPEDPADPDNGIYAFNRRAIESVRRTGNCLANPVECTFSFKLTVDADAVPAGKTVRAWMPFPRSDQNSIKDIKVLETSEPSYIISPEEYVHTSIYMEKPAVAGQPTVFSYTFSFVGYSEWYDFSPEDVKPYDTSSELYKTYTAQRDRHVIFTDRIRKVTAEVVGDETNPFLKARRIYDYIVANYPWASAREYSTLENIPMYVLENHHGDCGQVGLLYITMCRCAGIPARWQSGWEIVPDGENIHDWQETYYEGIGWVPTDVSAGRDMECVRNIPDEFWYYTKGLDAYRIICNSDFGGSFYPAKKFIRSETVDFQRGEVEWDGGNLYFDQWTGWTTGIKYKPMEPQS